ncbi:MAG: radical SAM protein [Acidobacteria bacterium]|nr:MAG: radical SAM protein [Acidobacteriota bacterium]
MGDSMLVVHELYVSVQGESTHTGRPCAFVRLTACDLRCSWCDTPYAFTGGKKMSVDEVVAAVEQLRCPLVEITGGEPLLQRDVIPLMQKLVAAGHEVLVETGGHLPISELPPEVVAIVDVKCPGSGEAAKMHWPNLDALRPHDEVKFVIKDRADYEYARTVVRDHDLASRVEAVLFSPVHGVLAPADLAKWMLDDHLPVRLQLQQHKYVWDPQARGV